MSESQARMAVLTALAEEIDGVLRSGHFRPIRPGLWEGNLAGVPCIAAVMGIGKVNAAGCTQMVIDRYHPQLVLHLGTAGSTNLALSAGDLVIGGRVAQHDLTMPDETRILLDYPLWDETPEKLLEIALSSRKDLPLPSVKVGRVVTGDRPIVTVAEREMLRIKYGADCVDMESAAVAHICAREAVHCLIVRAISDRCDQNTGRDFKSNIVSISENLSVFAAGMATALVRETWAVLPSNCQTSVPGG